MGAPYIPTTDGAYDSWSQNFSTKITAAPATYGLIAADATAIAAATALYHNAYLIAGMSGTVPKTPLNPTLRTKVTINTKDAQKAASLQLLRTYAIAIRNNLGVSDANKTALGLTIVKTIKTPVPAPVTYPILSLAGITPGQATIYIRDSGTPTVRKKPAGATYAQVAIAYGPTVPSGPDAADFHSNQTKSPCVIDFAAADAGKTAYIWCRWGTQRQLMGPWSGLMTLTVPLGGT